MSDRLPIDAYAIALDETSFCIIDEADAPLIDKIVSVYLFDRNQRTHCCELTPSYWLIHLYDQVRTRADADLSDDRAQELYNKYESFPGADIYVHCHEIDHLIDAKDPEPFTVYHYGETEVDFDDCDYDEQMESLHEHLCGNCPF